MKKIKTLCVIAALAIGLMTGITGCDNPSPVKVEPIPSDSLYVEKVENMPKDFILGMDASQVLSLEESGVKYYDYDGNEADVFETLAKSGINYIRVRVWVDPYDADGNGYGGGNCDINTAIAIGERATKYGMKLLVNFHYSDFWADPAKQMVPKAWAGMDIDTKANAVYEYTLDCLNKLKKAKVDVGMVQVGNETNGAICGEKIWMNIYKIMAAGSKATREVFPDALVAVHFANPEKVTNYADYAKKLNYYNLDYDVFASSYYPYWHGTLDNLTTVLNNVADTYGKKVMVAETSYAYTTEDTDFSGNTISGGGGIVADYPMTIQGQANHIRNVVDTMVNDVHNGIGVFYWEGTWISVGTNSWEENSVLWEKYGSGWASSYAAEYDPDDAGKYYGGCACDNQALFDAQGKPLESLKVFSLLGTGNKVEVKADAIEAVNVQFDLNGTIVLPDKVNAVMSDNSKQEVAVTWKDVDYDKMYNGGVAKYDIIGEAGGMEAHCYVSMIEFNFLKDYSFEEESDAWVVKAAGVMDELMVEDKATDSLTGTKHYHFWSANSNTVNFDLEQEVKDLPAGTYKYSIAIMGGDCGETNIYAYVKVNGEIVAKDSLGINGYNNWESSLIENIVYNGTDTIVVGIHVECSGEGAGAWGKIDDALLNSVAE
ncbi:MAG: extra-cellular endo-beta-1,4-galactanase [Lachnospiraceae bacterium]|nr:extra-cellular endo-beta-1,4-galactanase [Lachnospiraceae bacterium]